MQGLVLVALATICACGNHSTGSPDARADAQAIDASFDASEPDAFDACPGQATFEVGVVDWVTGESLAGVKVSDGVGEKSSAPNGRVVLCVAKTGALTIRFTLAEYLERVHSTTGEIVSELAATPGVATFRLLRALDADALYTSVGSTRDLGKATAMAMVRERQQGGEIAGATVSLVADNDGAYTPGPSPTTLTAGNVSTSEGRVLFLNALPGSSALSVTGLSGCAAPASALLAADSISSVTIVCSP